MTKLFSLVILYKGDTAAHILKVQFYMPFIFKDLLCQIYCRLDMIYPQSVIFKEEQQKILSCSPQKSLLKEQELAQDSLSRKQSICVMCS